jgi:hypothetical protein
MYEEGHNVNWTSFSSTTTDENVIKAFSQKHSGTWMIIKGVTEGIRIPFSLYPNENEVLLYPNTTLRVDHLFSRHMKRLTKHPEGLDIIEFTCVRSLISAKEKSLNGI